MKAKNYLLTAFLLLATGLLVTTNAQTYCTSGADASQYGDIGNFKLNTIDNGTQLAQSGNPYAGGKYSDYTYLSTQLTQGVSYPISIRQISSGGFVASVINVFIDYNHDGVFDSSTERVFTQGTNNGYVNTGTIIVPYTATAGTTRLRVILDENGTYTSSACGSYTYGETEDYNIDIVPAPACSGTPVAGSVISTTSAACNGTNFTLSLSGATKGVSGLTYQWQSSSDDITYADIVTATDSAYITTQTSASYYKCVVTCSNSGLSAVATPIYITMNSVDNCYCSSTSYIGSNSNIGNVTINTLDNGVATPVTSNPNSNQKYTNYTALTPTDLAVGVSYPISISQISNSGVFNPAWINVFIDYNHDGIFDVATERAYNAQTNTSMGGNVVSGSVTIPITATLGATRMRVILDLSGTSASASCGSYTYGETEDYTVNIIASTPCSASPAAGSTAASATDVCNGINFILSLSGANTNVSGLSYQWQSSSDNVNYNDIATATNIIYSTNQTSAAYYKCVVTCSNSGSTASSTPVYVAMSNVNDCYCSSGANLTDRTDIGRVTMHTLDNGTVSSVTNNASANQTYNDYTSLPATNLIVGESYQISISQITSTSFTSARANVFIDYDKDGVYNTATERAYTALTSSAVGGQIVSGTITIPVTATLGTTRMRVILDESGTSTSASCGNYSYGETEDYTINIIASTPCSASPDAGYASASATDVCSGANFTLSLSGANTDVTGLMYQWQSSSDNVNYSNIATATKIISTTNQASAAYYRCVVTCSNSGSTAFSTPVYVAMSNINNCYCSSYATSAFAGDIGNVTINTLNNGVATPITYNNNATQTYTDYTSLAATNLIVGESYPISISQISRSGFYGSTVNVFIDYDRDGILNTATEIVYSGYTNSGTGGNIVSGNIAIPVTASLGTTRMRVILNESSSYLSCGTYTYGETEDYTVNIIGCTATTSNTVQVACESYTWNGNTYNTSGTYKDTIPNAAGCDSVMILNLTVNQASASTTSQTVCSNYLWNGTTYSISGTYLDTIPNAAGCDSIMTLNLTIKNSSTSTTVANNCNSYLWNGNTYTNSGTYKDTIANAAGCDSVMTLNLTVSYTSSSTEIQTACNSYVWNGNTYTNSGTFKDTIPNTAGCDSVMTLSLTINNTPATPGTISGNISVCSGSVNIYSVATVAGATSYTWSLPSGWSGTSTSNSISATAGASGSIAVTANNTCGASPAQTINVTVNTLTSSVFTIAACNSYTWNGSTYSSSGIFKDTIPNAAGCDSVMTLNLTINSVDASVTQNGNVLTATTAGASYQWIDCANGNTAIVGETGQSFTATITGTYAAIVTKNACTDTSACFPVTVVGIAENSIGSGFNIYPNPSETGVFNISFNKTVSKPLSIAILDMTGRILYSSNITSNSTQLDLSHLVAGVYYIRIDELTAQKLVIQ